MNFITFPANATNLFPAANSTNGSQLVTEWNLRSREMVETDPSITYQVGPSFVHGEKDFEVRIQSDAGGTFINTYTLEIAEGRGVINGHYVETLVPMSIDLVEANLTLQNQSRTPLKGNLAIGMRTFYATDQTVAGSILVENEDDMFLGIQMVILPEEEFITPSDSPTDQSKVTADIKLATFTFLNNNITALKNLSEKMQYISSDRVTDLNHIVSSRYITKTGLNSKKLYVFGGKGADLNTGYDTWEDATDSLMIWDSNPQRTSEKPAFKEAQIVTASDNAYFVIPHRQVTGMTDDDGNDEYYAPKILELPTADYTTNTAGMVNSSYTKQIKEIATKVSLFQSMKTGKQIYFMDSLASLDELPSINSGWAVGDYVLVKSDIYYLGGDESDDSSAPSTMYVVLPGQVATVKFIAALDGSVETDSPFPDNISGTELGYQEWYESAGQSKPGIEPDYYPSLWGDTDVIRGLPGDASTDEWEDYFRIRYYYTDDVTYSYTDYFYAVATTGARSWSDTVVLTGSVALATESIIGGFLNAAEDATDYGYVRVDDTGHLRLIDYSLLRSGTLAYQLASDLTLPSGSDLSETQTYLTEYVNERIAFPNNSTHGSGTPVIHIYMPLSETDSDTTLEIKGVDSRFNTAVCLHILGTGGSNITINIRDCQKFMIDSTIEGSPVINIFRTCLYYDPVVLQYIKSCERDEDTYGTFTGFKDFTLWYERIDSEDPELVVDGMTVSELDAQIITEDINYWKELGTALNDNDYLVALKSITFSGAGDIVGCEILAANNSTDNVEPGDKIVVGDIILPQGSTLIYPTACLTRKLKVSGQFTSAYYADGNWYVTDNSVSLMTGTYDPYDVETSMTGTVAFHSVTTLVPSTISQTSIDVWEPDAYHILRGGAIS